MSSIFLNSWLEDTLAFSLQRHGNDELSVPDDPPPAYGEPLSKSIELSMGGSIRPENMACIGGWMQSVIVPISPLRCSHSCLSLSSSLSFSNGLAGLPFPGSGHNSELGYHPGEPSLDHLMAASTVSIRSRVSKHMVPNCMFENSPNSNASTGNVDHELAEFSRRPLLKHKTTKQKLQEQEHRVLEVVDRHSYLCSNSDGDSIGEASDALDSSNQEDLDRGWVFMRAHSE